MSKLKRSFFERDTVQTAVDLLGCFLVRKTKAGDLLKGCIVETEAYLGLQDDCCHSFGGRKTDRTKVMYMSGGYAYVYFTYGMHYCFNIVTAGKGEPEAVLIRALEPLQGIAVMKKNRFWKSTEELTTGPAKLCQAFNIDKNLNGEDLEGRTLYVTKGRTIPVKNIAVSERIGLSPFFSSCYLPLRFYVKGNPFVSVKNL